MANKVKERDTMKTADDDRRFYTDSSVVLFEQTCRRLIFSAFWLNTNTNTWTVCGSSKSEIHWEVL